MPVIVRPESMIFGNTLGSFVSSTMLTESSNPTMAKKASAVAAVTDRNQPFSSDAADYTKLLAVRENRHVDPQDAVRNLLDEWSKGNTKSKRDRALARRLASTRSTASDTGDGQPDDEIASLPGVIDLLARRAERRPPGWDLDDDLDVFEKYQGADDSSYEVFDE